MAKDSKKSTIDTAQTAGIAVNYEQTQHLLTLVNDLSKVFRQIANMTDEVSSNLGKSDKIVKGLTYSAKKYGNMWKYTEDYSRKHEEVMEKLRKLETARIKEFKWGNEAYIKILNKEKGLYGQLAKIQAFLENEQIKNHPKWRKMLMQRQSVLEKSLETLEKEKDSISSLNSKWKRWGETLVEVGIVAFLYTVFKKVANLRSHIIDTIGTTNELSKTFSKSTQSIVTDLAYLGIEAETVAQTFGIIRSQIGTTGKSVKELTSLTESAALFQLSLGLSVEQSAHLAIGLSKIGKTAKSMLNMATKEGMKYAATGGEIVRDMAELNDQMFLYDPKKLAQASGYAKTLGMNLKQAVTLMEEFADMSSGIEKSTKINLLTGSKLNAQLLYRNQMLGDIQGTTEHIAKQMAQSNWGRGMAPGLQKIVAKELGMTSDEIDRMVMAYRAGGKALVEYKQQMQETEDIRELAMRRQEIQKQLWNTMQQALKPLIVTVGWLSERLTGLMKHPIGKWVIWIGAIFLTLAVVIRTVKTAWLFLNIQGIFPFLKAIPKFVAGVWAQIKTLLVKKKTLDAVNRAQKESNLLEKTPGKGFAGKSFLQGATAMLATAAAMWVLAKALQEFAKVGKMMNDVDWGSLAKIGVFLVGFTGVIFGLGALMSTGLGAVLFSFGILAILGLATAIGVLGFSLGTFAKGATGFSKGLNMVMTSLSDLTTNITSFDPLIQLVNVMKDVTEYTDSAAHSMMSFSKSLQSANMSAINSPLKNLSIGKSTQGKEETTNIRIDYDVMAEKIGKKFVEIFNSPEYQGRNIVIEPGEVTLDGDKIGKIMFPKITKLIKNT